MAATVAVFVFPTPAPPARMRSKFCPIVAIPFFCKMLVLYPPKLVLQSNLNFYDDYIYF